MKWLNGTLLSSSQVKVSRGRCRVTVGRVAAISYLRCSTFSSEPSPIQPPAATPVNITGLPSAEVSCTRRKPSITPIQLSAISLRWQTNSPWPCSRV